MSDPFHPYKERYTNPQGPGDKRPTALEILKDNDRLGGQWGADKVILITGATSGIGVETARAFHETGAHFFFTARDVKKAQGVVEEIKQTGSSKAPIEFIEMDMDSLESVKRAAKEFLSRSSKINILVNNAGS